MQKTAKAFEVPTLFTTVVENLGGSLVQQLLEVFPEQKPFNRTMINSREDPNAVDWVTETRRKK
ncbi:hypothetical protein ACNFU2_19905 [Chryseobacterium sp. PTM-20240506]|uniref:hypothetical protein n=1 Tax=Chryseobacterium sp. PTM-20240506 TaxID=3400631 RepID=UPI003AAEF84E